MNETRKPILKVRDLRTYFHTEDGIVKAVDGVDFEVYPHETLGIVGESGCGKSVTSYSVMRLLPARTAFHPTGSIEFWDEDKQSYVDLLKLPMDEMRKYRGSKISMIFQEPMSALNPLFTIGDQLMEVVLTHRPDVSRQEARERAIEMLAKVGIPAPEKRVDEYPHEMSGGMRQRVVIAMALMLNPSLIIADEPTTALDVTIQAQILELMKELQEEFGTSYILITHNLGVVAQYAHRIAVMYLGRVVEYADIHTIFKNPLHPYTIGLLKSIPRLDVGHLKEKLPSIPGTVPNPMNMPKGCRFNTRCSVATEELKCFVEEPPLVEVEPGHFVRCWKYV